MYKSPEMRNAEKEAKSQKINRVVEPVKKKLEVSLQPYQDPAQVAPAEQAKT